MALLAVYDSAAQQKMQAAKELWFRIVSATYSLTNELVVPSTRTSGLTFPGTL
jgi:hypothetical protein